MHVGRLAFLSRVHDELVGTVTIADSVLGGAL
jgi:hypothetical protein